MDNMDTARKIFGLLRVKKNDKAMLDGLKAACADCDKYGPPNGKPCMALRLALDYGCEYNPPSWCKDTPINPQ